MGFEKVEKQPGREGQDAPLVLHDVHIPVTVQVADREGEQLPRPEFLLHSVGGQNGCPDVPEDGLLDSFVTAELQGHPKIG
jgi:hypothetical protein